MIHKCLIMYLCGCSYLNLDYSAQTSPVTIVGLSMSEACIYIIIHCHLVQLFDCVFEISVVVNLMPHKNANVSI